MTHPQAEIQRLIDDIDDELGKLRALVKTGEQLRERLFKQLAAAIWEDGDQKLVRIIRDDP